MEGRLTGGKIHRGKFQLLKVNPPGLILLSVEGDGLLWASDWRCPYLSCDHGGSPETLLSLGTRWPLWKSVIAMIFSLSCHRFLQFSIGGLKAGRMSFTPLSRALPGCLASWKPLQKSSVSSGACGPQAETHNPTKLHAQLPPHRQGSRN